MTIIDMENAFIVSKEDLKEFRIVNEKKNALINLLKISNYYEDSLKTRIEDELGIVFYVESNLWNRILGSEGKNDRQYYINLLTGEVVKEEKDVRKENS